MCDRIGYKEVEAMDPIITCSGPCVVCIINATELQIAEVVILIMSS